MRFDLFKRKRRGRKGTRLSSGWSGLSGVFNELPRGTRLLMSVAGGAVALLVASLATWWLFNYYYYKCGGIFELDNLRDNITIVTGTTLTEELICEVVGLHEGVNLFDIPIDQRRQELIEQAPNIKSMSITRTLPRNMSITVIEREPIAKVGDEGKVVDNEGVVFVRYAQTGGLPLITGSDSLSLIKQGDRLSHVEAAALRVVESLQRPTCGLRLLVADVSRDDYMLLTFDNHRQAKLCWHGMNDEKLDTRAQMEAQLDMLDKLMNSEVGSSCLMWDARVPGRIAATLPGDGDL